MKRNIDLIVLDSVRKDFFDSWAKRIRERSDISIEQARAPSHASMFTGELPHQHGVHTYHRSYSDLSYNSIFHTSLPHNTVGVSSNVFAGSHYDFDNFFDSFIDISPSQRYISGLNPGNFENSYVQFAMASLKNPNTVSSFLNAFAGLLHNYWKKFPTQKLVDDTGKAVLRNSVKEVSMTSEPWFLFVNFMDAHIPLQDFRGLKSQIHNVNSSWSSDCRDVWELMSGEYSEYRKKREGLYGAYIEYLDRILDNLIQKLEETTERPTTIIITADHGENHGEKSACGMANHKSSLSEQLLHVPLEIINPPKKAGYVEGLCSLLDIPNLVTAIANDNWYSLERDIVPAELMGMSAGPEPPNTLDHEYYNRGIRAVYNEDIKIVWDSLGNARKYLINKSNPSDQSLIEEGIELPNWAKDQYSTQIKKAVSTARSSSSSKDISDAVSSRLEELGYKCI